MERVTIGALFDRIAIGADNREALVFPERGLRWTYRELHQHTVQVAKGLIGLGIDPGDHVAVWATNWPEWVLLQLATAKIGAVLVTVNPAYRAHELAYVLEQSEATALFMIDRFRSSSYLKILAECCPEIARAKPGHLASRRFPRLKRVALFGDSTAPWLLGWSDVLRAGAGLTDHILRRRQDAVDPDDPVNVQYTSGTTGFPKGAELTHVNLVNNAYSVGSCLRLTRTDRVCVPVPFYHCFGSVLGTLMTMTHGATMVVPAEHFDAAKTLAAVATERCTVLHGVPTMFIAQLEHPRFATFDLASLRTGIMAGAPCPTEVMRQVVDRMHAREITIAYGQTEASPVITQTRPEDPISLRVSTVGRPLPGVEVRIVDTAGHEVPRGTQGELCCRGYLVMRGYYKMPEATAATIDRAGWLHTGDLATMDDHGYCRITGRIKDMIIRGGENVYPREIEEFLHAHPKVAEVQVFGVADPVRGEEIAAWIRLVDGTTATTEEIRTYCREHIAHYKVPRYVRFVDDFPMTVTGKVQKFKMRETTEHELGLVSPRSE
jgi:fatty-acyl-CoA synthase